MKKLLLFLALLALIILIWCCIKHHAPVIQQDITDRTQQALLAAGFEQFDVNVDGRDVYLHANKASTADEQAALAVVEQLYGVRVVYISVDNQMSLPEPTVTPPVSTLPASSLEARYDGQGIILSGQVASDEEIQFILSDVAIKLGDEIEIVNNLTVGSEAAEITLWQGGMAQLARLSTGSLLLNEQTMRLTGQVASADAQQAIQSQFNALSQTYTNTDISADLGIAESFDDQSCQQRLNQLIENASIRFASAKAEIDTASFPLLNRISVASQRCKAVINISGHTDSQGDASFNQLLSQQRAEAVKQYFLAKGVSSERIKASGYGESQPVADNSTRAGRALNRRIEFNVE